MTVEKKRPHNKQCTGDKHQEHLCYLIYEGYHYANPADYKSLVSHAEHICQGCTRTAKNAANLCLPSRL